MERWPCFALRLRLLARCMPLRHVRRRARQSGRRPGEPAASPAGQLVIFKPAAKPVSAEGVGKYAIKFSWNDSHDLGIYSWKFLREVCPCEECKKSRAAQ